MYSIILYFYFSVKAEQNTYKNDAIQKKKFGGKTIDI